MPSSKQGNIHSRNQPRSPPSYVFPGIITLCGLSLTLVFLYYKVDDLASKTKTLAGHNLKPTPWHPFTPKTFNSDSSRSYKILQCTYLTCPAVIPPERRRSHFDDRVQPVQFCPEFFHSIRQDLEPWAKTGITPAHVMGAEKSAALRIVIVGGRLYVDLYYDCVQSRGMFTVWGILQLLRRYPGMVPDVDIMFDCMDKPIIDFKNHTSFPLPLFRYCTSEDHFDIMFDCMDKPIIDFKNHTSFPLPLFRYCTSEDHFDIPFPDWSFWGWPEVNLQPWNEEFQDIKHGSQAKSWSEKIPFAYWKGNPNVLSPLRAELVKCNDTKLWGAEILRQNWEEEAKGGFEKSKLSNQCNHRYKIYAEGYAWSVSLKYILSCNSVALIISQQFKDFFSRALIPKVNYFPIPRNDLCQYIKSAVDWGNANPSEAMAIGKAGQDLMESLSMDRVYEYMYHLISGYAKLQDFKPAPPPAAIEACEESLLCLADPNQRKFLEKSLAFPSPNPPCSIS